MSSYNLFNRFEDALQQFHATLEQSTTHYRELFKRLVDGGDIHSDLVEDIYFYALQQTRFRLQEEQQRISRILGDAKSVMTLSEIKKHAADRISLDLVQIGKNCIALYTEIKSYMSCIERYFGSKVGEYRAFFERIYNDVQQNQMYSEHGTNKSQAKKQGLLIRASV